MAGRKSVAWALLAAVGACAESSNQAAATRTTKLDQPPTPIAVKSPICDVSEAILPLSGVCDTGLPSLYADMDSSAPLAFAKCVWKTFETQLSDKEALRFRLQDCSAEPEMPAIDVAATNRTLSVKLGDAPQAEPFLTTYELNGGDGISFLDNRRKALSASERDRCVIRPYKGTDFTARKDWKNVYEIAPNPAYMAEIKARQEPVAACGAEGWTNDGVQFWELRDGEAWFWEMGQDAPLFDPRSFTMMERHSESGAWDLENMKTAQLAN